MKRQELTASFIQERNVFLNDGGQTRIIIGTANLPDGEQITVKGEAREGQLARRLVYRFFGSWRNHPKWGRQFAFESFVQETPVTRDAVVAYLGRCDGIGPAIARRIWDTFGAESTEKLRTEPGQVAEAIKGLTAEKASVAAERLEAWHETERSRLEVYSLLGNRGIRKSAIEQTIVKWGVGAVERIQRNPYLLMQFDGVGFLTADQLYLDLGKNPAAVKRQALCAWHSVKQATGADTWVSQAGIKNAIRRQVAGAEVNADRAIRAAKLVGLIVERDGLLSTADHDEAERVIVEEATPDFNAIGWPDFDLEGASDHQTDEAMKATRCTIGILAGGPGTGKTYTAAAIVHGLLGLGAMPEDIIALAPTGKAAVRIGESLASAGLDCILSKTIHSYLFSDIDAQFALVDEGSMVDAELMAGLLIRRAGRCTLFLGDINQLPPVGAGAPLRDMIAAGVPCGTLTEVRRNSGQIVKTCALIRESRRYEVSEHLDLDFGENLIHVERRTPEEQIAVLSEFFNSTDRFGDVDPIWGVQIVVPMNDKGPLSRKALNGWMQDRLNPDGKRVGRNPFRVGDKIVNGKNSEFPLLEEDGKAAVMNGEQAEVLEVEENRTIARLVAPERIIIIPHGAVKEDEDGEASGSGSSWDLAYAISVHKSQGSEWPVVVVMVDEQARMVQSRQWIYTAISRAKSACVTIGRRRVIDDMLRRDGMERKTLLAERIRERRVDLARQSVHKHASLILEGVC